MYKGTITQGTLDWFLNALWPEGLSQGVHQLRVVEPCSLIDEATSGQITYEEQRNSAICNALVRYVQYTKYITPITLKVLLIARGASLDGQAATHQPQARWTRT
ncbi:hypothetical protein F5Y12DRAFT_415420 [Xylaria sp. FL1777]|nr:hypothetical protein F5Y12DRAFT_415420 [Xylaria sp. FL1777]